MRRTKFPWPMQSVALSGRFRRVPYRSQMVACANDGPQCQTAPDSAAPNYMGEIKLFTYDALRAVWMAACTISSHGPCPLVLHPYRRGCVPSSAFGSRMVRIRHLPAGPR